MVEVGLVGPGRVGRSLTRLLPPERFRVGPVLSRNLTSARRAVREMEIGVATDDPQSFASCDVILTTVPDAAIPAVAERLAQAPVSYAKKVVLHTSGVCDSSRLALLRERGASVGSMHPICVFQRPLLNLGGVYFAVEGDLAATNLARRLVRSLDGEFQLVKAADKFHHCLAKSMAADLLTGLMEQALLEMAAGGFSRRRGLAAVSRVLQAALDDYGRSGRNSRPGPLLQGNIDTVRQCLAALHETNPKAAVDYSRAARRTLEVLQKDPSSFSFRDQDED